MRSVRNRTDTATIVYRDKYDPQFDHQLDAGIWIIRDDEVPQLMEILYNEATTQKASTTEPPWYTQLREDKERERSGRLSQRDPMEQTIPRSSLLRDEATAYVQAQNKPESLTDAVRSLQGCAHRWVEDVYTHECDRIPNHPPTGHLCHCGAYTRDG